MSKTKLVISFGSSNTIIYMQNAGVVLNEPTLVVKDGHVRHFGYEAKAVVGRARTSSLFICPVEAGEIVNETEGVALLKHFLSKIIARRHILIKPQVQAAFLIPCGLNEQQKTAFKNVAYAAGISKCSFIPTALGTKFGYKDVVATGDTCVAIDIGGGKTDIGIVAGNNLIAGVTLGIGGKAMDFAIMNYVQRSNHLKISMQQAEKVKAEIGSLLEHDRSDMEVSGMATNTREPMTDILYASDVSNAVIEFYKEIALQTGNLLKGVSSDIATDVLANGILLSGGGTQIVGLDSLFKNILSLPISTASDLELVAVIGAAKLL